MARAARRAWSDEEEESLLEKLTTLVNQGVWQAEHEFRPSYLGVLENQMRSSFPQGGIAKNHIEAKIKNWKQTCFQLQHMLQIPGFGWNAAENRLLVEDAIWNQYVKVNRRDRQMREMQFPNYNRWCHCFGREY
ncbi:uncharacterized protein LOC131320493 [Rhododendron vialii]|uniref:uncharacterized protein LOC131302062 n=1 Tax=Rhododendron vialii TaxID=182163 RepID=UPI00265D92F7|nr:uncharacterized protein LOC131302062 [Rhododendron vialii]XP_058207192.1 uncharacterized protein LOC131320493 [Rhododendron vialii]